MKAGLLQYVDESERDNYNNGMFATENIIKDIKRRLNDYTPVTFGAHLVVKLGATLMDGSLKKRLTFPLFIPTPKTMPF